MTASTLGLALGRCAAVLAAASLVGPGCVAEDCMELTLLGEPTTEAPARILVPFSAETCAGEPVPNIDAADIQILDDRRVTSDRESSRGFRREPQDVRFLNLLLLDLSGSILRAPAGDAELVGAAQAFVDILHASASGPVATAVFTFDGRPEPTMLSGFDRDADSLKRRLGTLDDDECAGSQACPAGLVCAGGRCVDDSTNLYGAILSALEFLETATATVADVALVTGSLVVFTDGTDQADRASLDSVLSETEGTKHAVFTIGLEGEIDRDVLEDIGRDGHEFAADLPGLRSVFESIATQAANQANKHYLLEYCSPRRSGDHVLELVVETELDSGVTAVGYLSTNYSAGGFTAGCEL